jgi:DNA-binding MarR family transcriptional regulator
VTATATRTEAIEELRGALHGVLASLRRLRGRDARDAHGLTFSQYRLVGALGRADELSAGELAAAADLSPASATQMLDQLVEAGLVERTRSERDRRLVLNRLTPEGRRLHDEKHAYATAKWDEALADLDEVELRHGVDVLERVQRFFDEL